MSGVLDTRDRLVLPRWYPFATASRMGELASGGADNLDFSQTKFQLDRKLKAWEKSRRLFEAVELVGTAVICRAVDDSRVADAAKHIEASRQNLASIPKGIASAYRHITSHPPTGSPVLEFELDTSRLEIARLKALVRRFPHHAVAWADLSYYYALLGQDEKCEKCMDIAISLGSENRYILRSSARCYLHLSQPDKALYHLRGSQIVESDPWLVSAEIAISESADEPSILIRRGRSMASDHNHSDWSLNELLATLGTSEAKHGTHKKSKKLIRQALLAPNENTVAQVEWLSSRFNMELGRPDKQLVAMFEADARLYFKNGWYEKALESALQWCSFQPFASSPAVHASYIASVCLENYSKAIELIKRAQRSSPDSFLLLNNLAFAYASNNCVHEAQKSFDLTRNLRLNDREEAVASATSGLIDFRRGESAIGRMKYRDAISSFKKLGEHRSAAIACFYWAREEVRIVSEFAADSSALAEESVKKLEVHELMSRASQLRSNLAKT